ncbi:MAG: hypothetical protein ACYDER_08950 [Ktedonobacteraceae bacterium]
MNEQDPQQVIIEGLRNAYASIGANAFFSSGIQSQKQEYVALKNENVNPEAITVHFLQNRCLPNSQAHFVAVEGEGGQQAYFLCCVCLNSQSHWEHIGGGQVRRTTTPTILGFGTADTYSVGGTEAHNVKTMPEKSPLRVNFSSLRGKDGFWAGASFLDHSLDVERVRLIFREGIVLEDTVQDDLVLFITEEKVTRPFQAEFYDRSGNMLGAQSFLK